MSTIREEFIEEFSNSDIIVLDVALDRGDFLTDLEYHEMNGVGQRLFDFFSIIPEMDGGMPYGTQKARDGDPDQWLAEALEEFNLKAIIKKDK